jgi:hypothetical protein
MITSHEIDRSTISHVFHHVSFQVRGHRELQARSGDGHANTEQGGSTDRFLGSSGKAAHVSSSSMAPVTVPPTNAYRGSSSSMAPVPVTASPTNAYRGSASSMVPVIVPPRDGHAYCCAGGATVLKTLFNGQAGSGTLTLNSTLASEHGSCVSPTQTPVSNIEVRLVDCSDPCLQSGDGIVCSSSGMTLHVVAHENASICFANYDTYTNKVVFDVSMQKRVTVYFIPDGGAVTGGLMLSASIDSTCSSPLRSPYAQIFIDACVDANKPPPPLNLDDYPSGFDATALLIKFIDGKGGRMLACVCIR